MNTPRSGYLAMLHGVETIPIDEIKYQKMIKATELRIGNWVKDAKGFVNVFLITMVDGELKIVFHRSVFDSSGGEEELLDNLYPIPLTPEILEKCGFVWNNYSKLHYHNLFVPAIAHKAGGWMDVIIEGDEDIILASLQFIHQLQNLYFALTGQELNIEL